MEGGGSRVWAVAARAFGGGLKRVERILGGAVAPDGLGVQHAGQHGEARVAAVLLRELGHQLAAAALLPPVVRARVLRECITSGDPPIKCLKSRESLLQNVPLIK